MAYKDFLKQMESKYNSYTSPVQFLNTSYEPVDVGSDAMNIFKQKLQDGYLRAMERNKPRTALNRIFDALMIGVYPLAGTVKGLVDNGSSHDITPLQGFVQGLQATNPFGRGNNEGRYTYSDVLEASGWRPTTFLGKLAKGTVGFAGDIFLDPTTYLTGGLSAILKGTGKVGEVALEASKQIAKATAEQSATRFATKLVSEGHNIDDVRHLVQTHYDNMLKELDGQVLPMTEDVAQHIINQHVSERGINLSSEQLASDANNLTRQYNKLLGYREPGNGLTLSLGNVPFGDKIFGKLAEPSTTLIHDSTLRSFGDKTFAPAYQKLRQSIYGTQIGRLLSTKSGLYNIARENPSGLYEFMKFVDYTKGLNLDKIGEEKRIRDMGKRVLNLSPAEQKDVLDLLQDPSIWNQINKITKATDTVEGSAVKAAMEKKLAEKGANLKNLLDMKTTLEDMRTKASNDLAVHKGALSDLEKSYQDALIHLDTSHHANKEQMLQHIDALNKEIEHLKSAAPKVEKINPQDIVNKFDIADKSTHESTVESLNKYLFDGEQMISPIISSNNIKKLVDMVRKGDKPEFIRHEIEKNAEFYSGRANDIYPFIGEVMGYGSGKKFKSWDEMYTQRLQPIADKLKKGESLNARDNELLTHLTQIKKKRDLWLARFNGKSTPDILKIKQDYYNTQMFNDLHQYEHLTNSSKYGKPGNAEGEQLVQDMRNKFVDDISADEKRLSRDFNVSPQKLADYKLSKSDELDLMLELAPKFGWSEQTLKYLNSAQKKFIQRFLDMAPYVLARGEKSTSYVKDRRVFQKTYDELTDFEKQRFVDTLIKEMKKRKFSPISETHEAIRGTMTDIQRGREAGVGDRIRFTKDGKIHIGYVDKVNHTSEGVSYIVKKKNGEVVHDVKSTSIQNITAKEKLGETAQQSVKGLEDVKAQLESAKQSLADTETAFSAQREELISTFKQRIEEHTQRIEEVNSKYEEYSQKLASGEFSNLDNLQRNVEHMESVLSDDDALETYIKTKLGFNQTTKDVGVTILDSMKGVTDRTKEMVKAIRGEFMDIAKKEVSIGKLSQEQIDSMLMTYVAHISTPEFQRFLASQKAEGVIRKSGTGIGVKDLGFGSKFNPFSKTRTIKGKTIDEINEFFSPYLKGKNAFSDSISDIYVARALKHTELMYDDQYMKEMLHAFGREIKEGNVEEGYRAVGNYGQLRQTMKDLTSMQISMNISDDVSAYVSALIQNEPSLVADQQRLTAHIDKYIKDNYNDNVMEDLFNMYKKHTIDSTGLHSKVLDDFSVPLVEMNAEQIKAFHETYDNITSRYRKHLEGYYEIGRDGLPEFHEGRLHKSLRYGGEEKYQQTVKLLDKLNNMEKPTINQVADVIVEKANQARKLQIAKDQNRVLNLYDKFTHLVKLNMTTVVPSFHVRNKLSNIYLNWLGVGRDAFNLQLQKMAFRTVRSKGSLHDPDSVVRIIKDDGGVDIYHWNELYELAKAHGVVDEGFFAKDIGAGAATKGVLPVKPKFDPTDSENFFLYKKGAEFGNLIENSDRLIHFVSRIKEGLSPAEAARETKEFIFDYADITGFEQAVMKRVLPFYTWLRKNSALQVRQLIEQPGKFQYVDKAMSGVNNSNNESERIDRNLVSTFAKDWVQLPLAFRNSQGRLEPILWNPNLPYADLGRIPDPTQMMDSLKQLFSQSNPLLKVPTEEVLNKNIFLDAPIVKKGDNQVEKRAEHILGQSAVYNVGNGVTSKTGIDQLLQIVNATAGVKMLSYDYDAFKHDQIKKMLSDVAGYSRLGVTAAQSSNSTSTAKALTGGTLARDNAFQRMVTKEYAQKLSQSPYGGTFVTLSPSAELMDNPKYSPPTLDNTVNIMKAKSTLSKVLSGNSPVQVDKNDPRIKNENMNLIWTMIDGIAPKELKGKRSDLSVYYVGKVTHVQDGDTITVDMPGVGKKTIRMLLVDTPETVSPDKPVMPYGKEASNYTKSILSNQDVHLYFDSTSYDKYGRMLAYVHLPSGQDYNQTLLQKGLADVAYAYEGSNSRYDAYKQVQNEAFQQGKGIWSIPGYANPNKEQPYNLEAVNPEVLKKLQQR